MHLLTSLALLALSSMVNTAPVDLQSSPISNNYPRDDSFVLRRSQGAITTAQQADTPPESTSVSGTSPMDAFDVVIHVEFQPRGSQNSRNSKGTTPRQPNTPTPTSPGLPPGFTLPVIIMPSPAPAAPSSCNPAPPQGGSQNNTNNTSGALADLVPGFGVMAGTNANAKQQGSCDGFNGAEIALIPCSCPPDRVAFIDKLQGAVAAGSVFGQPIAFSADAADQSPATNRARATAMLVVLQSFGGSKGVGCPAASAPNFLQMQKTGVRIDGTFISGNGTAGKRA